MNEKQIMSMLITPIKSNAAEIMGTNSGRAESNCHQCIHRRPVPGNCHIECVKPDTEMTGNIHGIRNGWFMYPMLFDPVWMTKTCSNYEPVSLAVESSDKSE